MEEFPLQLSSGATLVRSGTHLDVRPPTGKPNTKPKHPAWKVPLKRVLWASVAGESLEVALVVDKKGLVKIDGKVKEGGGADAGKWAEELMTAAYAEPGAKPQRRFLVIVNPHGGPGKAAAIYKKKVEPILSAARCTYKAIFTEYYQHAVKIGEELAVDDYDCIISISGDGIVHELYNGMAKHETPRKAFRVPIAPIPAGSGNGLSLNLLGLKEGNNVVAATLNAIKGRPMAVDVCSIVQDGKRTFSYMSQCLGLMADLDLGTEHLRILGSNRFVYGYLRGVVTRKSYPYQISIKAMESDKQKMSDALRADLERPLETRFIDPNESLPDELPPLRYADDDASDWIKLDESFNFLYGGKCAYVSRDLMQFPAGMPNDGAVELTLQRSVSRGDMLSAFDGAENGIGFWRKSNLYYKAYAYRCKPLQKKGFLSIDGEKYPFGEFHVECHQGLGTMMSCYGHYATEDNAALKPPPAKLPN
ncbi:unnamed protein product [Peniophora sp. CBMAI 1063]|nr:unnamed protein product [Peniophora sp. CBMAI 1063]